MSRATGSGDSLLDPVTELVDHSLLHRADRGETPRFETLETVREYAAELLAQSPQQRVTRDAHAELFWRNVEHLPRPPAAPNRAGPDLLELEPTTSGQPSTKRGGSVVTTPGRQPRR